MVKFDPKPKASFLVDDRSLNAPTTSTSAGPAPDRSNAIWVPSADRNLFMIPPPPVGSSQWTLRASQSHRWRSLTSESALQGGHNRFPCAGVVGYDRWPFNRGRL